MKKLLLLAIFPVLAANTLAFELDGFKSLKFGMLRSEIAEKGYVCKKNYKGDVCVGKDTLFGNPADIDVEFLNGISKVSAHVSVAGEDADDLEKVFVQNLTKELGSPISFEFIGATGLNVRRLSWVSASGSSIFMSLHKRSPSDSYVRAGNLLIKVDSRVSVHYLDSIGTRENVKQAESSPAKSKDF